MEPEDSLLLGWLLVILLVLIRAFFTMSEVSIIALNDNKVKKLAAGGDKNAKLIEKLTDKPSRLLAAIQFGSVLSSFFMSVIVVESFYDRYVSAWSSLIKNKLAAKTTAIILVTIAFLLLSIVFGKMVPRRMAVQYHEKVAYAVAPPLYVFSTIISPFVAMFSMIAGFVLRLLGIESDREPVKITEEEIRMMVEVGGERGSIEESEKDMINSIFEFDDRTVDEMMTHRTEIVFVDTSADLLKIINLALSSGYSRIPVCEDDLDSILGVLYVKDLLALLKDEADGAEFSVKNYMREPLYVLESNTCSAVLSEFKAKKIQIGIVVDEYGGTSGLVTMEDLLESIVGNIQDEYDDEEEDIFMLGENRYLVDGLTSLEDIDKYFSLNISEDGEFDTISGYIVDKLGRIPSEDEHPHTQIGGYNFIVSEMDERRVVKLEVEKIAIETEDEGEK